MFVPYAPKDILADLSAWRRRITNMIQVSQLNGLMADLAEQLFNPETISEPGSLMLGEYSIKMMSYSGSLPEIQ